MAKYISNGKFRPHIDINLLDLINLVDICHNTTATIENFTSEDPDQITTFKKLINRVKYVRGANCDVEGIVNITKDLRILIITINGTHSVSDWIDDFNGVLREPNALNHKLTAPPEPNMGIEFHAGFLHQTLAFYKAILDIIQSFKVDGGQEVIFCGHSLGGAVASILAYHCEESGVWGNCSKVVTYGAPKFCNAKGVAWFEDERNIAAYIRIANYEDTIPYLPPKTFYGYAHIYDSFILFKNGEILLNEGKRDEVGILQYIRMFCSKRVRPTQHSNLVYTALIKQFPGLHHFNV